MQRHQPSRGQRLAAGGIAIALDAEERHDAIADELVEPPAGLLDRPPHRVEIAVQDEHDVVGQPPLGERGEAADIGEQDGDLTLAALREIHPPRTIGGVREMRQ